MKQIWNTTGIILTAALILVLVSDTNAGENRNRKAVGMSYYNNSTFSVTGHYVGSLDGRIRVGGREVYVPRATTVYVVGHGIQEDGYFVNNELVFVSGVKKQGKWVATMVVVRPSSDTSAGYRRTGGANPLVGEFADDVPE